MSESVTSPLWDYFELTSENESKCKICGTLLSREGGGSTKSMKKHLEAKHGAEFKEYIKKKSEEELSKFRDRHSKNADLSVIKMFVKNNLIESGFYLKKN
uniref:BED-type domain-containing protein n=1 Tax=Romanomermis culicivorax TaxID=13658 RepID=A0A915HZZ7_ROMCU